MDILLALEVGRYDVLLLHSRIIINIYHRYSRLAYVFIIYKGNSSTTGEKQCLELNMKKSHPTGQLNY